MAFNSDEKTKIAYCYVVHSREKTSSFVGVFLPKEVSKSAVVLKQYPDMGWNAIVFNHQGTVIATAGDCKKDIMLWDPEKIVDCKEDGVCIGTLKCHGHIDSVICALAFNQKGTKLAGLLNDDNRTVVAWNVETTEECEVEDKYRNWFNAITVYPDGKKIMNGKVVEAIQSWNGDVVQRVNKLSCRWNQESKVYIPIACNKDGKKTSGKNPKFNDSVTRQVALSNDGKTLARAYDVGIALYDLSVLFDDGQE